MSPTLFVYIIGHVIKFFIYISYSDEGKLKWLLNELQTTEQRHLVPLLEGAVEELLGSLHQLQEENTRLEDSWRRYVFLYIVSKAEHVPFNRCII